MDRLAALGQAERFAEVAGSACRGRQPKQPARGVDAIGWSREGQAPPEQVYRGIAGTQCEGPLGGSLEPRGRSRRRGRRVNPSSTSVASAGAVAIAAS